jgi:hypothetical protein
MVRTVMLRGLVDVFEEGPVAETTAFGTLAARLRHDVLPAHAMGRSEGPEYFQDISQFRCQFPVRRRLRLMRLLEQLGPQGRLVPGVVKDPDDGLASVRGDDRRDPIPNELVVGGPAPPYSTPYSMPVYSLTCPSDSRSTSQLGTVVIP